ncbi:molybdenum cofactor guanylyltransferase [Bacillus sp. FJAT-44742]|uniref:molybdenum cofactor guanylyltransferase n=1 Tax=Bacillus sp. FJAT-44742 TaxID=2014005 RepID=UPI0012FF34A5|nr:molybdenum cofactor guanylyltransferase [Bacillus sp. FJAT-44742]
MNLAGVVLAGGKSSRYGRPKMFEIYNGKAFYEHSVEAFSEAGICDVFILSNESLAPAFQTEKAEILVEKEMHKGPLYALYHVLEEQLRGYDWVFLLAADVPFVSPAFVRSMKTRIVEPSPIQAYIPKSGEKFQPLHGIYHRSCLPVLKEIINRNKSLSMKELFQDINVHYVTFAPEEKAFININRPEEWENNKEGK